MWNGVLLYFLVFVSLERASATYCYISEIYISPISEVFNRTHQIKNCREQGRGILPVGIPLPEDKEISCFKIVGTDPHGNSVDIKGCIPTGHCDVLKQSLINGFKMMENRIIHLAEDTKCFECEGINCNKVAKISSSKYIIALLFFINTCVIRIA